ncbi:hypothetical protein HK104_001836 [Borealophlyctis nickersoniae]|nr:hypothetical protein HK104_001836 [Borealophlyctis nickersoniae]
MPKPQTASISSSLIGQFERTELNEPEEWAPRRRSNRKKTPKSQAPKPTTTPKQKKKSKKAFKTRVDAILGPEPGLSQKRGQRKKTSSSSATNGTSTHDDVAEQGTPQGVNLHVSLKDPVPASHPDNPDFKLYSNDPLVVSTPRVSRDVTPIPTSSSPATAAEEEFVDEAASGVGGVV